VVGVRPAPPHNNPKSPVFSLSLIDVTYDDHIYLYTCYLPYGRGNG
jgi:hypothetical protein